MSVAAKREALFHILSKNLEAACLQWPHLPQVADSILCPLCRHVFGQSALQKPAKDKPALLSFEHAIPGAVGGTDATGTLVCTPCNNECGSKLDAHLSNRLESEAFFQGHSRKPLRSTLIIEGIEASINWGHCAGDSSGQPPASDFYIVEKATRQGNPDRIKEAMLSGAVKEMKLTFTLPYVPRLSQVALLRAAFLVGFRKFGYAFALNQAATPVLKQIHTPTEPVLPDAFCVDLPDFPADETTILIVKEPRDLRSLLVVLRLEIQGRVIRKGVILPGPFDLEAAVYQRHSANCAEGKNFEVSGLVDLNEYEVDLTNADHLLAIFQIWNDHCGRGGER